MDNPDLMDWAIAPLTWLERARGWKRPALLLLYATTLLVVGVLGWRGLCLWGLPDIGEPFDVDRYGTVEVRDADNAMVLYREAAKKMVPPGLSDYKVASSKAWDNLDWSTADPEVRRWVVDNRPAFALWLEGTERPDSLFIQPREMHSQFMNRDLAAIQQFAKLAMLEASALELVGDFEGAWRLHRAALRTSRHNGMHGGQLQRWQGLIILEIVRPRVLRWADDPRITSDLLRRAIADVEACRRMTSPEAEMIRVDYFAARSVLDHPEELRRFDPGDSQGEWYSYLKNTFVHEGRAFLMREPERSRRVLNLVVAGQLAQDGRPSGDRPRVASRKYTIYEVDARTPKAVASIAPEELASWANGSAFGFVWDGSSGGRSRIEAESGIFDAILIGLAERAFRIEHGRPPETYGELLGPYLQSLPEGIEAADRVSAASTPN